MIPCSPRPAEFLLTSHGQLLCSSCAALERASWFGDEHRAGQETQTLRPKEGKSRSARKQVADQTGLTEAFSCLYEEICPRNVFHILRALPLNSRRLGDGYFRGERGPVTQTFGFFKAQD